MKACKYFVLRGNISFILKKKKSFLNKNWHTPGPLNGILLLTEWKIFLFLHRVSQKSINFGFLHERFCLKKKKKNLGLTAVKWEASNGFSGRNNFWSKLIFGIKRLITTKSPSEFVTRIKCLRGWCFNFLSRKVLSATCPICIFDVFFLIIAKKELICVTSFLIRRNLFSFKFNLFGYINMKIAETHSISSQTERNKKKIICRNKF